MVTVNVNAGIGHGRWTMPDRVVDHPYAKIRDPRGLGTCVTSACRTRVGNARN
jgi:hypothetical protein